MKKIILACALSFPLTGIVAQEATTTRKETVVQTSGDSIIILKGDGDVKIKVYEEYSNGDTKKEEKIYEGVYLTRVDEDRRTLLDALPFTPKKRGRNHFSPHASGIYLGFTNLSTEFFNFSNEEYAALDLSKSWEIGFNLLDNYINLSRNRHWGLTYSLGWGYRAFRLDGNKAFLKEDGATSIINGTEDIHYTQSRLRYFYFRIPISIEWQTKINNKGPLFLSAGPEVEIRHGIKSMAKVNGNKETLSKGLYVNPVGINLLAQVGYDDLGFYLRYSTYNLLQKNKGPELYPLSFGVCWYW